MYEVINTSRLKGVFLDLSLANQRLAAIKNAAPHVEQWLYWCTSDYSATINQLWIEHCLTQQQLKTEFNFAFISKNQQDYIGESRISSINFTHGFANLSYWVNTNFLQQGFAVELIIATAQFCFKQLNLIRVEIVVDIDNQASINTAKKVGGQLEGKLRHRSKRAQQPRDSYMFGLFPDTLISNV